MTTAIWWIRRDLRLYDNQALAEAMIKSDQVIPLFILDTDLLSRSTIAEKRLAFLLASLRSLDEDLCQCGSRLILRQGNPKQVLARLVAETNATVIYAEADYSPYAQRRDQAITTDLPLQLVSGLVVHPPTLVLKSDGTPYTVFTPYSKRWKSHSLPSTADLLASPEVIKTPTGLVSDPLPDAPILAPTIPFPAGEKEARRRLDTFVNGTSPAIFHYAESRDQLALEGTSGLSPYLHLGLASTNT